MNSDPNQVGIKHDQNKPKFSLIPRVVTFGAKKYGPRNWVKTENLSERYTDAAMRHINAYLQGAPNDLETGLPHLAHAVTSLMFVIEHDTGALSEPQCLSIKDALAKFNYPAGDVRRNLSCE